MSDKYIPTTEEVRAAAFRNIGGDWFDAWLAEHDAALIDSLIEGIGSGTYTHQVGEGIEVALDQLYAAKAELREERA